MCMCMVAPSDPVTREVPVKLPTTMVTMPCVMTRFSMPSYC